MRFYIPILLLLTLTTTLPQQIKAGLTWSTPINHQELLLTAVRENNIEDINTAITNDANPVKIYDTGQNLIHVAAEHGSEESLNLLLTKIKPDKLKEYVDAQDNQGNSPLHLSSLNNHINVTTILLEQQEIKIQTKNKLGNTPFHIAALNNNAEILKLFLNKYNNLNINIENDSKNTPLHLAASNNSIDTLNKLLNLRGKNLEINAKNNAGDTALHLSAKYGADKTMKALMSDNRIDLNIKNKDNKTAQDLALESDSEQVLNIFAKKLEAELEQAKTESENVKKELALQKALDERKKKELEEKQTENTKAETELEQMQKLATKIKEIETLKNKLQKLQKDKKELSINELQNQNKINQLNIQVHKTKQELNYLNDAATQIQAAFRGHNTRKKLKQEKEIEVARIKIQSAIQNYMIREKLKEQTRESIERKQMKIEENLSKETEELKKQEKLEQKKKTNASIKIQKVFRGYLARQKYTLRQAQGKRVREQKDSLLRLMSELGIKENKVPIKKIKWLKKLAPKTINHFAQLKDEKDHTILHLFATYGLFDENLIQKFIKNGGDINAQNNSGETALHLSILNGYNEQSIILINLDADITIADDQNDTPLHWAILAHNNETLLTQEKDLEQRDNTELIQKLINEKTINAKNKEGNTALHLAAFNGHTDLIEILVNNCSENVDTQNKKGGTALHLAAIQNHTETVNKLIEFKANVLIKTSTKGKGFTAWDYVKDKPGFKKTTNALDKVYLTQLKAKKPRKYKQIITTQNQNKTKRKENKFK